MISHCPVCVRPLAVHRSWSLCKLAPQVASGGLILYNGTPLPTGLSGDSGLAFVPHRSPRAVDTAPVLAAAGQPAGSPGCE